jgi:FlaA1/EpsC-like NDP-sugar epimerase
MAVDALLLLVSGWMSFWLRLAHPFSPAFLSVGTWLLPVAVLLGLPLYLATGQYKGLTRYVGSRALYDLSARTALLTVLLVALGSLLRWPMPPRSSWVLFWILLTGFSGAARFLLRDLLLGWQRAQRGQGITTVIYGAGAAGAQLAKSMLLDNNHSLLAFVDDDPLLWGRSLAGVAVVSPQELAGFQPDRVLLAIPSLKRADRRRIMDQLQALGMPVLQVPSIDEISSGRARIDSLRPVAIEELLGRDPVPPQPELLGPGVCGKTVLVSGAGGSIGSELCRQILRQKPRRLVLLERSEPSLYAIDQELGRALPQGIELVPVLGSAADPVLVETVLRDYGVEVIFHAAAYKHVPMVEANPLSALKNNLMATQVMARAAIAAQVESFMLISTDKAVRPTNVMGASKRSAELVVQALARELEAKVPDGEQSPPTRLSMVRFGNVLGSSGSVVPLFRQQIANGGPITLTHPEIVRFFMTIPEAAQLVIQAAVLARGGDLFLLDMGEPVRIKSLAEQMLRLSGLSLRDANHPDGDIEIVCTGLRPGEKLYEELLIDADSEPTQHPLIYRASERSIPPEQLWPLLERMEQAVSRHDVPVALGQLAELVPEWQRSDLAEPITTVC